jgi:hypothetical protein
MMAKKGFHMSRFYWCQGFSFGACLVLDGGGAGQAKRHQAASKFRRELW